MPNFPIQTAAAIVSVGVLLELAKLISPAVEAPQARMLAAVADFGPETTPVNPAVPHIDPEAAVIFHAVTGSPGAPVSLLEDQAGALDHFYQALWRTEKGEPGAITHIVHYGDSPTTADLITGDIRSQLQHRFGDGGHGFILIAKPWAWYQHTGAEVSGTGWQMAPASYFKALDGVFGLGGVSFSGQAGAHSQVKFRDARHSRFEVWFEQQPEGGTLAVDADGQPAARIPTTGEAGPGFAPFTVEPGARTIDLHVEQGRVRVFGLVAETGKDGVVYDSLGLNGASITVLSRMFNQAHWTAELRHRNPDLVVINYGTNEADFASFIDHQYEKELREAIRRVRVALPEASILVMSPMDRGAHGASGIETMATIPRIVALQKRVALETGCGFFDTFHAMGGEGTMARWYAAQPRLVSADLIHPYPAGGKLIGTVMVRELASGLNRFKLRSMQKSPVPESSQASQTPASGGLR